MRRTLLIVSAVLFAVALTFGVCVVMGVGMEMPNATPRWNSLNLGLVFLSLSATTGSAAVPKLRWPLWAKVVMLLFAIGVAGYAAVVALFITFFVG